MNKKSARRIAPSSNTAMETEIPAMLRGRERIESNRFTSFGRRGQQSSGTHVLLVIAAGMLTISLFAPSRAK